MDATAVMQQVRDALTAKRVFGEPLERDGVTVIPAAAIRGGGGGGGGETSDDGAGGEGVSSGGGFGVAAKPAGVFVVDGDDVRWRPAVDVNRIILGGQIVGVVFLLVLGSVLRRRR